VKTMLEKTPNFVLVSTKSSTYPRGYASGLGSPAAALDDLFEHRQRKNIGHYSRLSHAYSSGAVLILKNLL